MDYNWNIRIFDILTILLILVSLLLLAQIQEWFKSRNEIKQRRMNIFRVLMTTRLTRASPYHIESINLIPIEFYGQETVIANWKSYFKSLKSHEKDEDFLKSEQLFFDLLSSIAAKLNFKFKKEEIEQEIYYPISQSKIELEENTIRLGITNLLKNNSSLSIDIKGFSKIQEVINRNSALLEEILTITRKGR